MSEFEFDGTVLNPQGDEISLPYWIFKRLKSLKLLERDRQTGRRQISQRIFGLIPLWEEPDFRPRPNFNAFNPEIINSNTKPFPNAFIRCLGKDCSGSANPIVGRRLLSEIDKTKLPGPDILAVDEAQNIVKEIKSRRRVPKTF